MTTKEIEELATLCNIPIHPNPQITLQAIENFVNNQPSSNEASDPKNLNEKKRFNLHQFDLGTASSGNKKVDDAIRIIRLLHVNRLRNLQTNINELLSKVQKITGNPKADFKIGRVGK